MLSKRKSDLFNRLEVRLTVYYTLILMFLFVLVAAFFLYRLQHNFTKYIDQILRDELIELFHEIEDHAGNAPVNQSVSAEEAPAILAGCRAFEGTIKKRKHYPLYFRIVDGSGAVLCASSTVIRKHPLMHLEFPPLTAEDSCFYSFDVPRRSPFRCYQKRVQINGENKFAIQMATSTSETDTIFYRMLRNVLISLVVVLIFSVFFGLSVSRKPFEVMRRMNMITKRITAENLKERLPVPAPESEMKRLTETINDMLDRLENSFAEVMQFSSDVAHELRTPVFALKGELEVLLSGERTNSEYRETAEACLERVNGLEKIINGLFLISRFDSKKESLEYSPLNFTALVQDLYAFFLPIAQEKQLDFTVSACEEALVSKADKTRIQQLVSNLIDNAIKFTPEQGSVSLDLARQTDTFELRVRDSGIGIPEDKIQHIFKRFYQVDDARAGSSRGAGLGLQISQRIAEAHGGKIRVRRNEDKGVTFIVTLPLKIKIENI